MEKSQVIFFSILILAIAVLVACAQFPPGSAVKKPIVEQPKKISAPAAPKLPNCAQPGQSCTGLCGNSPCCSGSSCYSGICVTTPCDFHYTCNGTQSYLTNPFVTFPWSGFNCTPISMNCLYGCGGNQTCNNCNLLQKCIPNPSSGVCFTIGCHPSYFCIGNISVGVLPDCSSSSGPCPNGCNASSGICNGDCLSSCYDSDGGFNPSVNGTVYLTNSGSYCGNNVNFTDTCYNSTAVNENFCTPWWGSQYSVVANCPLLQTCVSGRCQ